MHACRARACSGMHNDQGFAEDWGTFAANAGIIRNFTIISTVGHHPFHGCLSNLDVKKRATLEAHLLPLSGLLPGAL